MDGWMNFYQPPPQLYQCVSSENKASAKSRINPNLHNQFKVSIALTATEVRWQAWACRQPSPDWHQPVFSIFLWAFFSNLASFFKFQFKLILIHEFYRLVGVAFFTTALYTALDSTSSFHFVQNTNIFDPSCISSNPRPFLSFLTLFAYSLLQISHWPSASWWGKSRTRTLGALSLRSAYTGNILK